MAEESVVRDSGAPDGLESQPPRQSNCPACGASPSDTSIVEHRLSDMGYLHDDQHFECSDCGHEYTHGVPVGEPDMDVDDLWCDGCDLGYMNVHRAEQTDGDVVQIHLKCAHHHAFDCPECETWVPADGVRLSKDHDFHCPFCDHSLPRDAIPYCHLFRIIERDVGPNGRALLGYPMMTGRTEGAQAFGYPEEED